MSVTINIHDAAFGSHVYEARHRPDRAPYAALEVTFGDSKAHVYLNDLAKCDALIKAACAAKDMLHAANHAAEMTDPLAPLRDREHYAAPERTATPAEHADTAARIGRARLNVVVPDDDAIEAEQLARHLAHGGDR